MAIIGAINTVATALMPDMAIPFANPEIAALHIASTIAPPSIVTINLPGAPGGPSLGCTNSLAFNYDPAAVVNDPANPCQLPSPCVGYWGEWSECSATCQREGYPVVSMQRAFVVTVPPGLGGTCPQLAGESRDCVLDACPMCEDADFSVATAGVNPIASSMDEIYMSEHTAGLGGFISGADVKVHFQLCQEVEGHDSCRTGGNTDLAASTCTSYSPAGDDFTIIWSSWDNTACLDDLQSCPSSQIQPLSTFRPSLLGITMSLTKIYHTMIECSS